MAKRKHPSGRPIREEAERGHGFPRPPREDFLTPGLRMRELASAIGFRLDPAGDDDDGDWIDRCRRR
jgi:hypothetical protein